MSSLLHRFFSSYSAKVSHCCGFSCEAWALGCAGLSSCGLQTDSSPLSRQGSPKAAPSLWNAHSSPAPYLMVKVSSSLISQFCLTSSWRPSLIYSPIPYHCHHHHRHHPGMPWGGV